MWRRVRIQRIASCARHCEERSDEAIHAATKKDGLLRGACHRARIRARALCVGHCDLGHRVVHYLRQDCGMILSFRDDWLREFFVNDIRSKKIPSDLEDRLFRKIQMIDDATTDRDLRSPPSNHFEKLRGNLDGLHSIRVNKRWRLVFRWNSGRGEAEDLYLDDHSYE
jgi:proteic killer suppression protein